MSTDKPRFPATKCGDKDLSPADHASLRRLQQLGFKYREQMEACVVECCEILGMDPAIESVASDIVNHGTPPAAAIEMINRQHKQNEASTH